MSALPQFALRPLAFPSHRFGALVALSTGRVVALRRLDGARVEGTKGEGTTSPSPPTADAAASGDTTGATMVPCPADGLKQAQSRTCVSAGGNARCARVLASTARPYLTRPHTPSTLPSVALPQLAS